MNLNDTPSSERAHIGIFGRTNVGKSSLINALTGQKTAIVSEVQGTTTDPVSKSMELLPAGPVVITDTAGLDDTGTLAEERICQTRRILNQSDLALIVTDSPSLTKCENDILESVKKLSIPYILVQNKCDEGSSSAGDASDSIQVSALTGHNINQLKDLIAARLNSSRSDKKLVADLIKPGDLIVLVVPIDKAAPKGRLILPQQMTIREILDAGAIAVTLKEDSLASYLKASPQKPAMVITDSQAFGKVSKLTPDDIPLTSFSILMARYKGFLEQSIQAVKKLNSITPADKILISEGCTHHRQCGDIGSQKIPAWLKEKLGFMPQIEFTSGIQFTDDPSKYALIIHCGGCMLNEREMQARSRLCKQANVPMTNYGILISSLHGILERAIKPLF